MSSASSRKAEWFTRLEPGQPLEILTHRADDPRLGEVIEHWDGGLTALQPGRAVILGFPQDEGVRRNHGRPGAAQAPRSIRHFLHRLTPWDGIHDTDLSIKRPLDLGDTRITGSLEESQANLGDVIGSVLTSRAVPIVLGGGHETAFGHFLGYVSNQKKVGIINLDAHLDVRLLIEEKGHSGSPFRQALEHPSRPLLGQHYVCLGAQPQAVSREHVNYVRKRGGSVYWEESLRGRLVEVFKQEHDRLVADDCQVYVSLDADVVQAAELPGVSAPNSSGLHGREVLDCLRLAGQLSSVRSMDLVEISPPLDRDGQSSRWAALAIWHFLMGLAVRSSKPGT